MKRVVALVLCIAMVLSGCGTVTNQTNSETATPSPVATTSPVPTENVISQEDELEIKFDELSDAELLDYVENTVYAELVELLDPDQYYVEGVETRYVSREYLEEVAFNSQSIIFFGYTLAELNEQFQGARYIYTLGEDGQTTVQELVEVHDDTYDRVVKNVLIGSGVILVCVTVAVITKNPAASATAGRTVKLIFTASSMGAKAGTKMALQAAGFGGLTAAVMEGFRTGDWDQALKAGFLGASEGFKFGAIFGTVEGIADGIIVVGNTRFFKPGSPQALKYPEGVEFSTSANGVSYPRFEKWAKATAKFDTPTLQAAANHTGLSGTYYWDAKLANAQCGFSQTPAGYVWHHVEDMQTMILIPQDLHSVAMGGMSHTGGASLISAFLGL